MHIELNEEKRTELKRQYKKAKGKSKANKINVILLLDEGYSYKEISAIFRLDDSTIRGYERQYLTTNLDGFTKSNSKGGICKMSDHQLAELINHLTKNIFGYTSEIVDFVSKKYKVHYTLSGMAKLLKRIGFVYKKPVLIPGKLDPSVQLDFIEYLEKIKASMKSNDKLYFLDGVHPQHNSTPGFGWILKGTEKQLKSNSGRQRLNINGAIDPESLEVILQEEKTLNSASTISFLKYIEKLNKHTRKIVLVVDNAPYYYNGEVLNYIKNSNKMELVYLPSYSPNLNPIERFWKFMKKKVNHNKYYSTFKEFREGFAEFYQKLPQYYSELRSLITDDFQTIIPQID